MMDNLNICLRTTKECDEEVLFMSINFNNFIEVGYIDDPQAIALMRALTNLEETIKNIESFTKQRDVFLSSLNFGDE